MSKKEREKIVYATRIELINELAFLTSITERIWKYHPINPSGVNIVDDYNQLKAEIGKIEKAIKEIDRVEKL